MKQVFTSKKGVILKETIEPSVGRGDVKIKVLYSCISSGTEMTSVRGANKSLLRRAIDNPNQVKQALEILKNEGLQKVLNKVDSSMEKLGASGYSVSGIIVEVGEKVSDLHVGDYVSAGGGTANHAEYVVVPRNLVVKIPSGLSVEYSSMATVGSIAMHGVRRAGLTIGEYGVVVGCGLMGLLAIQMMKASGVKVACTDVNDRRLALAKELGADKIVNSAEEDPVLAIQNWTDGHGADAVLFTAATHADEPLSQSFRMCRKKGKVVLLGVSGMNINREDIYKNEIDFQISTSYGPGRYDDEYEQRGLDYPYAYVRWTENRNMQSFLELMQKGVFNMDKMAPKVYPIERVSEAYEGIQSDPGAHIITILDYAGLEKNEKKTNVVLKDHKPISSDKICIGLVGVGSFATSMLLPIITSNPQMFYLKTIVNRSGAKALNAGNQFKAEIISSDLSSILDDPDINLMVICTRHGNHAELVLKGLQAGKNVYVEKPLATTIEQLDSIRNFYSEDTGNPKPLLMVGFNRRFSTYCVEIKRHLEKRSAPVFILYRMNAGYVPSDGWVHGDGGRIIGEGCHIIDLMQYLVGSEVSSCSVSHFHPKKGIYLSEDNRCISLEFEDGSVAVIDYISCGNKEIPKEYMEVHYEGKTITLSDYQKLEGYGVKLKSLKSSTPAKGHKEEWNALYHNFKEGTCPIPIDSLIKTTELSILASQEC